MTKLTQMTVLGLAIASASLGMMPRANGMTPASLDQSAIEASEQLETEYEHHRKHCYYVYKFGYRMYVCVPTNHW